jgi:putative flippase GtrA
MAGCGADGGAGHVTRDGNMGGDMVPDTTDTTDATPTGLRHWLGFGVSGSIAFLTDATILKVLQLGFGMPVSLARVISISIATVAGWLAHRRFTFNMQTPPTAAEFMRYAGVAWVASTFNYAVFVAILWLQPALEPLIALFAASIAAMAVAYLGMRFAAFRRKPT